MSGPWTLSMMAWLSAVGAPAPEAPKPWAVALTSAVKVRPPANMAGAPSARLSAARGECEGVQVLALPPAKAVEARPLLLKGPGEPLPLRLYREEYVEVRTPSNSQGEPGLWPDPLIPVEDAYAGQRRRALPADSSAERPLVLYLEACVPEGQRPGTYRGELTLTAAGRPAARVPVELEVQPFALPATSSLPNSFGLSLYSLARGHGLKPESPEAGALLRDYATALLRHRLSAHGMSLAGPAVRATANGLQFDFSGYDREVGPFLSGEVLPSGARFTTADVRRPPKSLTEDEHVAYYRAFREHFAERGWKALLFFYAKDEPKPEEYGLVLSQAARVHKSGGIPVLVTAPLDRKLVPAADILCPVLNCFFARTGPQTCSRVASIQTLRRELPAGTRIWWYQSCMSQGCTGGPAADPAIERAFTGWASYMVDHPALLNRAMGPLAFLTGIDGELYYDTVQAYDTQDPWKDVFTFGGNGDGTLFYPGTPGRVGGTRHVPIESLRLKLVRDGLEDYEYLRQVERFDPALAHRSVEKLARSGYEITREPSVWEQVRGDLTAALRAHAEGQSPNPPRRPLEPKDPHR